MSGEAEAPHPGVAGRGSRPLRVLHAYNLHRGIGGSDKATVAMIRALRDHGVVVDEFVRSSRELPPGLAGRWRAFAGGLYAREAVRAFGSRLALERPDVVHVHELYPLISHWVLPACARAGIPVVMQCNDYRLTCPVATHYSHGETCRRCAGGREHWCVLRDCRSNLAESAAFALRNASSRAFGLVDHVDAFVMVCEDVRRTLIEGAGVDPALATVNPCLVEIPPEPVEDPAAGAYVAYAGRFVPEKGVDVLVEACRLAGLPLRLAGDAPSHPAVRPGDDTAFVMTGSSDELASFYRGARVLAVPSLWLETFGMVAAEAMSHGIPVVASRIGALPELVEPEVTGLLTEPGDARSLAGALTRIWNDPALARRLGAAGRAAIAGRYSPRAHVARLLDVYRGAIARRAGP